MTRSPSLPGVQILWFVPGAEIGLLHLADV
jgi:hypothetical protein